MDHSETVHDDPLDRATEALCQTHILPGPTAEMVARVVNAIRDNDVTPRTRAERTNAMKRFCKLSVAASVCAALGFAFFWIEVGGNSTNIAFAQVADALDHVRSATFDTTLEVPEQKSPLKSKGMFLTPSHERIENFAGSSQNGVLIVDSILILDGQAGKRLELHPGRKAAVLFDDKEKGPSLFEQMRRIVRQGIGRSGEKAQPLGRKVIDGREAVGFRTRDNIGEMTLWADPQTARPVRVEMETQRTRYANGRFAMSACHYMMNNFKYDVDLEPSLFRLDPPAGYALQHVNTPVPVEGDLIYTLRLVAEHGNGNFPAVIGMNGEVGKAVQAALQPEMDKSTAAHGKNSPELLKLWSALIHKPLLGIDFFIAMKAENDSHYVGGGVKLGTPDRPIFWYKPTGAAKYRVIYADLSVKELTAEEVKKLSKAGAK